MDPLARKGFGADEQAALTYERGRPGYAPELVPWLVERLALTRDSRVLDLAAGTGQLSRLLAGHASVVAVEPAAAMRVVLAARVPGVEVLEGVAEDLPLADASVDAVVVGNAFHWFDGPAAIGELVRVLRPGGGLAIVWNIGRESDPPTPELEAFVAGVRERAGLGQAMASETPAWRTALDASEHFAPLAYHEMQHRRTQDRDTFAAYLASLAFVAALPDRRTIVEHIRALCPESSVLLMRTECYVTRRD